jgi:hypothetical protein
MTACFADSFYFIALLNPADEAHARAAAMARIARPLVTTEWVLAELADGMADTANRKLFGTFLKRLGENSSVTIVPADRAQFLRGVELYDQRPDKEWSLTDCISFVVMREEQLTEALTGDHHFEQAGFVALLK